MQMATRKEQSVRWYHHIGINIYLVGLFVNSGTMVPLLLPYLVALFVPPGMKNTYLASVRVFGLAAAMLAQPVAGLLSDHSTSRFGQRRPYMVGGTVFSLLFLTIVGASTLFKDLPGDTFFQPVLGVPAAYGVLFVGSLLLQASANVAQGAQQGLIPDLVPEEQRGRSSGVKAVFELVFPGLIIISVAPLLDRGQVWLVVGIVMATFVVCTLSAILLVHEEPLRQKPTTRLAGPILRLVALVALFVAVTQGAVRLVSASGELVARWGATLEQQVAVVGLAGLLGMAGSIFLGVYAGIWVGIGREARRQTSFVWWVINRLLFLTAVTSMGGFLLYFLTDVLRISGASTATNWLLIAVALALIPAALGGGYLADRIGRKLLVALAALVAALGTLLLIFSTGLLLAIASGCIIGVASGAFLAANWALGTDLVPKEQAGKYLGISNLAGAGAGIVGVGIGGPMADSFNRLQAGLGYLVIFAIYGALFLFSAVVLTGVRVDRKAPLAVSRGQPRFVERQ
jgi:MFS family permease